MDIEALKAKLTFYAADEEAHAQGGGASHALTEAVAAIESLQCELEEARRSESRYQWLRKGDAHTVECVNKGGKPVIYYVGDRHDAADWGEKLDATIDAARKQPEDKTIVFNNPSYAAWLAKQKV